MTANNPPRSALDPKRLSTATARAALAGLALQAIDADDGAAELVITANALTHRFHDLAEVEAWLDAQTEVAR